MCPPYIWELILRLPFPGCRGFPFIVVFLRDAVLIPDGDISDMHLDIV